MSEIEREGQEEEEDKTVSEVEREGQRGEEKGTERQRESVTFILQKVERLELA